MAESGVADLGTGLLLVDRQKLVADSRFFPKLAIMKSQDPRIVRLEQISLDCLRYLPVANLKELIEMAQKFVCPDHVVGSLLLTEPRCLGFVPYGVHRLILAGVEFEGADFHLYYPIVVRVGNKWMPSYVLGKALGGQGWGVLHYETTGF